MQLAVLTDNNPNDKTLLLTKGTCLIKIEKMEEALVCLNEYSKYFPNDQCCLVLKARAFKFINRFAEAIKCFDEALSREINQENRYNLYLAKIESLNYSNQIIKLLDCLELAIKDCPQHKDKILKERKKYLLWLTKPPVLISAEFVRSSLLGLSS